MKINTIIGPGILHDYCSKEDSDVEIVISTGKQNGFRNSIITKPTVVIKCEQQEIIFMGNTVAVDPLVLSSRTQGSPHRLNTLEDIIDYIKAPTFAVETLCVTKNVYDQLITYNFDDIDKAPISNYETTVESKYRF